MTTHPQRPKHHAQWVDWEHRRKVILDVQANKGTARDAAKILGIDTDTALKAARRLGIRLPQRNFLMEGKARKPARTKTPTPPRKAKPNAGTVAVAAQNKSAWTAYHQRRRFAKAMEEGPAQPKTDAELVAEAVAAGKVTRIASGSALIPLWLSGAVDNCVKPRSGASKGARI